jgi:hypothetical protein
MEASVTYDDLRDDETNDQRGNDWSPDIQVKVPDGFECQEIELLDELKGREIKLPDEFHSREHEADQEQIQASILYSLSEIGHDCIASRMFHQLSKRIGPLLTRAKPMARRMVTER